MITKLMTNMMDKMMDKMLKSMLTNDYPSNPIANYTIADKLSLLAIVEAGARVQIGKKLNYQLVVL